MHVAAAAAARAFCRKPADGRRTGGRPRRALLCYSDVAATEARILDIVVLSPPEDEICFSPRPVAALTVSASDLEGPLPHVNLHHLYRVPPGRAFASAGVAARNKSRTHIYITHPYIHRHPRSGERARRNALPLPGNSTGKWADAR